MFPKGYGAFKAKASLLTPVGVPTPQLSEAVAAGVVDNVVVHKLGSVSSVIAAMLSIVGGVVSCKVIVKLVATSFPFPSSTVIVIT